MVTGFAVQNHPPLYDVLAKEIASGYRCNAILFGETRSEGALA